MERGYSMDEGNKRNSGHKPATIYPICVRHVASQLGPWIYLIATLCLSCYSLVSMSFFCIQSEFNFSLCCQTVNTRLSRLTTFGTHEHLRE